VDRWRRRGAALFCVFWWRASHDQTVAHCRQMEPSAVFGSVGLSLPAEALERCAAARQAQSQELEQQVGRQMVMIPNQKSPEIFSWA